MSKLAQDINSVGAELFEGRLAQDINSVDAELVQETQALVLTSPANGETGVALSATFTWTDSESRGLYRLVYDTDINFGNPTVVWTESTSYSATLTSGTYYWKVEAHNPVQQDAFVSDAPEQETIILWDANTEPAPIYVYDQAAPRTVEAANDLSSYIAQSSGKTAPTVTSQPSGFSFPDRCIKVGYPGTFTDREETLVKVENNGTITLSGVDEYDANNPNFSDQLTETEWMDQAGSYHAVMTFLHEHIGVVWGWMSDLGEAVPTHTELSIEVGEKRHTPSTLFRTFLGFSNPGNQSPFALGKDWLKRQRCFWSLPDPKNGLHGFREYYSKYHSGSQEKIITEDVDYLFALQLDNSRDGWPAESSNPNSYRTAKMEVGEPDLPDFWYDKTVQGDLSENSHRRVFSCGFNDNWDKGHSNDARARAMDYEGNDAVTVDLVYRTGTLQRPAITDRELLFAKRCADALEADTLNIVPADSYVLMGAYGVSSPAPKREQLRSNVIVMNTANDFSNPNYLSPFEGKTYRQHFDEWLQAYPGNQIWRPNLSNGYGHQRGMWMTQVHLQMNRLKEIIPQGVVGFTPDQFWEHWSTQWPMYYVAAQLMYDHTQDVDAILDKAYNTLFGNASPHIKAYYEATESVIENNLQHNHAIIEIPKVWTTEILNTLQGHLNTAIAATSLGSDERERVEWVQAGLDWCKAVVQSCQYWIDYNSPGIVTDETNLATLANAIEDDTDGVTGWDTVFGGAPAISQSAETNGSNFAFFLDANNTSFNAIERDPLPGASTQLYLISLDVKHTGEGGRFVIKYNDNISITTVNPDETEWKTIQFGLYGGDELLIQRVNPDNDGAMYIDNMKIQEAVEPDLVQIENDWNAHNASAIEAATDPKWDGVRPIGRWATTLQYENLPAPGVEETGEPLPGLE